MLLPFRYGPALQSQQIRLLKLKGGSGQSKLEFDLHIHNRGYINYLALSYAWLSPVCDQEVICGGCSLMITSSLKLALLRLQEKYADRYIWIDAVCINQGDPLEKSVQVRRMSNIYHDAQSVIVWLGEETESTAEGLRLLSNLCSAFPSCNGFDIRSLYLDHSVFTDPYELDRTGDLEKLGIPSDTASSPWQAAGRLLNASWFERRWILQEVANSTNFKFLIGSFETAPEILLGGAYRIADFPEFRHALDMRQRMHCDRVETIIQLLRAKQEPWLHESLTEILLETACFESTDPRDRVFAIVGCLKGFVDHEFWATPRKQLVGDSWEVRESAVDPQDVMDKLDRLVDYSRTMPQVLTDVAMCEVDRDEFLLSIFRSLCHVDVLAPDVPSWVPTWQFSTPGWRSLWLETVDPLNDGSYDVDQAELTISPDRKVLRTRAISFDKLLAISEPDSKSDGLPLASDPPEVQKKKFVEDFQERCDWLVQCERIATESYIHPSDDQERLDHFLLCYAFGAGYDDDVDYIASYRAYLAHGAMLWASKDDDEDDKNTNVRFQDRCKQLRMSAEQTMVDYDDEAVMNGYAASLSESANAWFGSAREQRSGRRFFATKNGRIGWAPQGARIDDELCVIFGLATPFTIRQVQGSNDGEPAKYQILGACYVHDGMDGEIFLDDSQERITVDFV